MRYNPQVHHRRSVRLPAYDYTQASAYFITICTHDRACIFDDPAIELVLQRIWARTVGRGRYPGKDEFVVMPNHVHGIVWIRGNGTVSGASSVGASRPRKRNDISRADDVPTGDDPPGAVDGSPLRVDGARSPRGAERGSLGALIASFKAHAAMAINSVRKAPGAGVWQRSYYEHIIRNEDDLRPYKPCTSDNTLPVRGSARPSR